MKVVSIEQLSPVSVTGCQSLRFITASHNVGFSVNKTVIPKGDANRWHYKYHHEACYCISGYGILTNIETGETFDIKPDTCYLLDNNDDHTFQAIEDTVLISIFNPPLVGNEKHDEDGSYSISEDTLSRYHLAKSIVEVVNNSTNDYDAIYEVQKLLK